MVDQQENSLGDQQRTALHESIDPDPASSAAEAADVAGEPALLSVGDSTPPVPTASPIDNLPTLRNWKTSVLWSVAGAVCFSGFVRGLSGAYEMILLPMLGVPRGSAFSAYCTNIAEWIVDILVLVALLVYVTVFYRSYFTEKPRARSSEKISFWNLALGGVIFGLLWNRNLTKSRSLGRSIKGSSYIVAIVISILALGTSLWGLADGISQLVEYDSTHMSVSSQSSSNENAEGTTNETSGTDTYFVDEEAGVTFRVPQGWEEQKVDAGSLDGALRWRATPPGDAYAAISYAVNPGEFDTAGLTKEQIEEILADHFKEASDGQGEAVTIGGHEYWQVPTEGTSKTTFDRTIPYRMTALYRIDGFPPVCFLFMEETDGEQASSSGAYYDDFMALVESVEYGD